MNTEVIDIIKDVIIALSMTHLSRADKDAQTAKLRKALEVGMNGNEQAFRNGFDLGKGVGIEQACREMKKTLKEKAVV